MTQPIDYKKITILSTELIRETGTFLRKEFRNFSKEMIETKGLHDFVSYVDKQAEKLLVDGLSKILPQAGFIVEEGTTEKKGEIYNWIVDPLDGTTNFIHGLSPFSISVALMENKNLVAGIVYEIGLDECFYAWKNNQAFLNGKEINVSKSAKVTDSLIAVGFPYYDYDRVSPLLKSLEYFLF